VNQFNQHPAERDLSFAGIDARRGFNRGPDVRCFTPFGGNSSSATTNEQPVATDKGRAQSGKSNTLVTDHGVNLANNRGQIGGSTISGNKGNVTITSSDPQVIADALDRVAQLSTLSTGTISDLAAKSATDLQAAQAANADQLNALLGDLNTLATNQQSGGFSSAQKGTLALAAGALALAGWIAYKRR
jgi:hypothetical protein